MVLARCTVLNKHDYKSGVIVEVVVIVEVIEVIEKFIVRVLGIL